MRPLGRGHWLEAFCTTITTVLALCTPALAQSGYVVGSLNADIARTVRTVEDDSTFESGNGQTAGGSIRVGVLPSPRFGIELEIARSGQFRNETTFTFPEVIPTAGGFSTSFESTFVNAIESRDRTLTIGTFGSARRQLNAGTRFVFLGGLVFWRTTSHIRTEETRRETTRTAAGLITSQLTIATSRQTAVEYRGGLAVGVEAHFTVVRRVILAPGVRMYGLHGGWLLRPGVGVGWTF
jgi:hypothetical protein